MAARKRNQFHWEGIRCFPQIRTLMRKKEKREFLSLFLRKSQEEQEQLIPEIISAGFCIYSTMPGTVGVCFALCALQWRTGVKSTVQGVESGCSQSLVMSLQSSTTEVSLEASGSLFSLHKIMDMVPWGFCCCFLLLYFVSCQHRLDNEVLRL